MDHDPDPEGGPTPVSLPPLDAVEREGQTALQAMAFAAATTFVQTGCLDDEVLERLGPAGRALLMRGLLKRSKRLAAAVAASHATADKAEQKAGHQSAKAVYANTEVQPSDAIAHLDYLADWRALRRPRDHHGMRAFGFAVLAAVPLTVVAILAARFLHS